MTLLLLPWPAIVTCSYNLAHLFKSFKWTAQLTLVVALKLSDLQKVIDTTRNLATITKLLYQKYHVVEILLHNGVVLATCHNCMHAYACCYYLIYYCDAMELQ